MKQFNLEEYLKNPSRKIVTRDGKKVKIICTDKKGNFPIVALIASQTIDEEIAYSYTKNGCWTVSEHTGTINDLFFAPEKKEGWVNIIKCSRGNFVSHNRIFESKENAEKVGKNFSGYLTTVKIEWEE